MGTLTLLISILAVFCQDLPCHSVRASLLGTYNVRCDDTNPCKIINSLCAQGICVCKYGYVEDTSQTQCLKVAVGYHDSCVENIQCSEFLGDGAVCEDGKCACRYKYHYLHGQCHVTRIVNEYCKSHEECYVGSEYQAGSCKNGFCECNDGFYQRESSACRRKQGNAGDECILDRDCDFEGGTCVSQNCVLDSKGINVNLEEIVTDTSKKDGQVKIGDKCQSYDDCKSIEHSKCDVNGTCMCKKVYFSTEDQLGCIPEIGEKCDPSKVNLQVEHAVCRENIWTCPIDRVASKDNRRCIELAEEIGGFCDAQEQCKLFGPRAECSNGMCSCNDASHYIINERFCWINCKIGSTCSFDDECYSPGEGYKLLCQKGVCACPDGWHSSEDQWYCLENGKAELGDDCENVHDCVVPNSDCQNKKCACKQYYFELDGQCVAGLNAECQISDECKSNNTICHEKKCKCKPDFVATPDVECLPISQHHDGCKHDVQCFTAMPYTFCNITGETPRCDCMERYFFKQEKCQPKRWVGDKCTGSDDCFTSNSHCQEGQCDCLPKYPNFHEENCNSSAVTRTLLLSIALILVGLKFLF